MNEVWYIQASYLVNPMRFYRIIRSVDRIVLYSDPNLIIFDLLSLSTKIKQFFNSNPIEQQIGKFLQWFDL